MGNNIDIKTQFMYNYSINPKPNWTWSELTEVIISGIPRDEFKFFKYK